MWVSQILLRAGLAAAGASCRRCHSALSFCHLRGKVGRGRSGRRDVMAQLCLPHGTLVADKGANPVWLAGCSCAMHPVLHIPVAGPAVSENWISICSGVST